MVAVIFSSGTYVPEEKAVPRRVVAFTSITLPVGSDTSSYEEIPCCVLSQLSVSELSLTDA
jgi:hypothetical protein